MAEAWEGVWDLVPELSHYDEGRPPTAGRYVIRAEDEALQFDITWTDAGGAAHAATFAGRADGARRPAGGQGMEAAFHRKGPLALESRAWHAGQEASYALRRASADGQLLSVLQFYNHPDGTRTMHLQIYRRVAP